ncbi:polymeric immunoglobulin receptor-like [Rhinichthys klamathensis goyatoka]|uniref:polymeric immunoglobulin receptor-like n=1 Tax=Rhinichthys klamathensis goyatoka TaxID=3034132 RepID=UPI0024B56E14|nr:polymeric immunoglobulin receptor-like [Rhinichthys klamathensis goyatoka]
MMEICDHKRLIFLLLIIMSVLPCETTEISTFTGYEGGKVEIRCPYESGYETHHKYLCRGKCPIRNKDIPVDSASPDKDRRFSLTDDTMSQVFTVTITDLRTEDKGRYWCAVRTRLGKFHVYTEILLEIKPVSVVSGVTGQHLNISCRYNRDLKNNIKFMCKGSDPSLCETSAIKVSSETNSNGRFSLRDDKSAGVFTVTITDLTLEDSGIYWCGAGERGVKNKNKWISATLTICHYEEIMSSNTRAGFSLGLPVFAEFLSLMFIVLPCETTEISTFTGYEGGEVEIRCPYESGYETHDKYLCRGKCPIRNKDIPVDSASPDKDWRFSLTDDTMSQVFTVTITDLRTEDKGRYWCGVKTTYLQLDKYKEINLEIKPVSVVSGVTGQHLNISCRYNRDLKNNIKFMCKGSDPSLCETSAIKVSSETNSNGRFSLRDDKSAGVFTVTITELTLEDSGIYWCGAGETGLKNKWISVTHLIINNGTSAKTSPKPTTTAPVYTSKPATEESASTTPVTSVCPSSSSTTSASVLLNPSSSNNAVPYQSVSGFTMFVMLVVIGILTGFGFSLFMYLRRRQKKEGKQPRDVDQGPTEHLPNRDMKPNREDTHTVSDYDEIGNTLDHPDYSLVFPVIAEHDTSVYALAQLPSSPSDNLTYSTIEFSSHHSDRTSDGQDTSDYAAVRP